MSIAPAFLARAADVAHQSTVLLDALKVLMDHCQQELTAVRDAQQRGEPQVLRITLQQAIRTYKLAGDLGERLTHHLARARGEIGATLSAVSSSDIDSTTLRQVMETGLAAMNTLSYAEQATSKLTTNAVADIELLREVVSRNRLVLDNSANVLQDLLQRLTTGHQKPAP